MSERRSIKINKDDFQRVVLTELLPAELPIIFSNNGFYSWLRTDLKSLPSSISFLVEELVTNQKSKQATIPLRYGVREKPQKVRNVVLLHPNSQVEWVQIYREFHQLLVYYCSRSRWSIRAPCRLSSRFYLPNNREDDNDTRLGRDQIDLEVDDKLRRHPGSFFAYRGHTRLHRFFRSDDLLHLERRFPVMHTFDISNCFGSVYTHSIAWALRTKEYVKERDHIRDKISLGSRLDAAMQRGNWKETNGIPVGPEISRIVAEIVLQFVDVTAETEIAEVTGHARFAVRRYVDDYFVFARSHDDAARIKAVIAKHLRDFNFSVNEEKSREYARPFITKRSIAIAKIRPILGALIDVLCETKGSHAESAGRTASAPVPQSPQQGESPRDANDSNLAGAGSALRPRRQLRSARLKRHKLRFVEEMKATAAGLDEGYDLVALYVLGTIERKIRELCRGTKALKDWECDYSVVFGFLIDLLFFVFSVHPTVEGSLRLSSACLFALRFLEDNGFRDSALELEQLVFEGCTAYLSDMEHDLPDDGATVERLNIVSLLGQLKDTTVSWDVLGHWVLSKQRHKSGYFQIIVALQYAQATQNSDAFREIAEIIQARTTFAPNETLASSELAHLVLDCMACPFLDGKTRRHVLRETLKTLGSKQVLSTAEADQLLEVLGRRPWFTDWSEVELLRALERRRSVFVY